MRASLLFNPLDAVERLALASQRWRRRRRLRGTPAADLSPGHLDSLELLELLRISPPQVIHDVGANVGTWTRLAKAIFPEAAVEAFEPLEAQGAVFSERTSNLAGVRLHPVALGPREGTVALQVTDFPDATSVLTLSEEGRRTFGVSPTEDREVRMATLDRLIAEGIVQPPDLLKLDVQGYELEVLKGGDQALRRARAVLCEVSFRSFYQGQAEFADIVAFLAARGFSLHAFGPSLVPGRPLAQADALFTRA
ncbi:MAG TPA: FkbM family methyltransferase [Opitutaceae bacterium]